MAKISRRWLGDLAKNDPDAFSLSLRDIPLLFLSHYLLIHL